MSKNDVYGKGLLDYYQGKKDAEFIVESDIAETEIWPIKLFFRDYYDMPKIEKTALKEAKGKTLDVGAGAGSHSLILQEKGFDVTAIDISPGAIQVMQKRGLKKVLHEDFFALNENEKYDTILMLMNGIGITGNINNLDNFFIKAKNLLNKNGKIILDSSDLIYLYNDGTFPEKYYGEINYRFIYNNEHGEEFSWIFVDFETLRRYAESNGFTCEKIYEDAHFMYLAKLMINI
ncbi:MAG: class I SAM-dependent methyltransferase [Bacteroidales bacterium]|jgi:sRNA-binding regulator protein Hfq|nr:class I SAM-dependent methyltransferase [Bacteroidales bacterium]